MLGLRVREQAGAGQHGVRRTPLLGMNEDDGVELGMVGCAPACEKCVTVQCWHERKGLDGLRLEKYWQGERFYCLNIRPKT